MASETAEKCEITADEDGKAESSTYPDVRMEGKKKKFKPLEAMRKFFKSGRKRSRSKDSEQVTVVSLKAKSTSALHSPPAGEEDDDDDDDGGFQTLSGATLAENRSRSEDSVFAEQREVKVDVLRKTALSMEAIHRGVLTATPCKSTSQESDRSLLSVGSFDNEDDPFKTDWKATVPAMKTPIPCQTGLNVELDLEVVAKTQALNTEAAKYRISIKPRARRGGTRQSRKNSQKIAVIALPSLNEESPNKVQPDEGVFSDNSLDNIDPEEIMVHSVEGIMKSERGSTAKMFSSLTMTQSLPPGYGFFDDSPVDSAESLLSSSPISKSLMDEMRSRQRSSSVKTNFEHLERKQTQSFSETVTDPELAHAFSKLQKQAAKSSDAVHVIKAEDTEKTEIVKSDRSFTTSKKSETVSVSHLDQNLIKTTESISYDKREMKAFGDFDLAKSPKKSPKPILPSSDHKMMKSKEKKTVIKDEDKESDIQKLTSPKEEYKIKRQGRSRTLPEKPAFLPKPTQFNVQEKDKKIANNAEGSSVSTKKLQFKRFSLKESVDSVPQLPAWIAVAKQKHAEREEKENAEEIKDSGFSISRSKNEGDDQNLQTKLSNTMSKKTVSSSVKSFYQIPVSSTSNDSVKVAATESSTEVSTFQSENQTSKNSLVTGQILKKPTDSILSLSSKMPAKVGGTSDSDAAITVSKLSSQMVTSESPEKMPDYWQSGMSDETTETDVFTALGPTIATSSKSVSNPASSSFKVSSFNTSDLKGNLHPMKYDVRTEPTKATESVSVKSSQPLFSKDVNGGKSFDGPSLRQSISSSQAIAKPMADQTTGTTDTKSIFLTSVVNYGSEAGSTSKCSLGDEADTPVSKLSNSAVSNNDKPSDSFKTKPVSETKKAVKTKSVVEGKETATTKQIFESRTKTKLVFESKETAKQLPESKDTAKSRLVFESKETAKQLPESKDTAKSRLVFESKETAKQLPESKDTAKSRLVFESKETAKQLPESKDTAKSRPFFESKETAKQLPESKDTAKSRLFFESKETAKQLPESKDTAKSRLVFESKETAKQLPESKDTAKSRLVFESKETAKQLPESKDTAKSRLVFESKETAKQLPESKDTAKSRLVFESKETAKQLPESKDTAKSRLVFESKETAKQLPESKDTAKSRLVFESKETAKQLPESKDTAKSRLVFESKETAKQLPESKDTAKSRLVFESKETAKQLPESKDTAKSRLVFESKETAKQLPESKDTAKSRLVFESKETAKQLPESKDTAKSRLIFESKETAKQLPESKDTAKSRLIFESKETAKQLPESKDTAKSRLVFESKETAKQLPESKDTAKSRLVFESKETAKQLPESKDTAKSRLFFESKETAKQLPESKDTAKSRLVFESKETAKQLPESNETAKSRLVFESKETAKQLPESKETAKSRLVFESKERAKQLPESKDTAKSRLVFESKDRYKMKQFSDSKENNESSKRIEIFECKENTKSKLINENREIAPVPKWLANVSQKNKDSQLDKQSQQTVKVGAEMSSEKPQEDQRASKTPDNNEPETVALREKSKPEKCSSDANARQSKVLDMVKNFQKLQVT